MGPRGPQGERLEIWMQGVEKHFLLMTGELKQLTSFSKELVFHTSSIDTELSGLRQAPVSALVGRHDMADPGASMSTANPGFRWDRAVMLCAQPPAACVQVSAIDTT